MHCGELVVGMPGADGEPTIVIVTSFETVADPQVGVDVHTK
jgi:hypothetical protein